MLVFRYDKSFDGLLSALFDAYSMRAFPEALIGPGEPEPLFTERVHDVATDEAHAGRVWRGLERRLTARTRSMFVYVNSARKTFLLPRWKRNARSCVRRSKIQHLHLQ